jgi:hypothetical protein
VRADAAPERFSLPDGLGGRTSRERCKVSVMDDDVQAIDDAARVMQIFFGAEQRRELARIEADLGPTMRPATVRRPRKRSLDKLIAKAKAAGATSVVIEGVEMRFGEPGAAAPTSNPWDEVLSRDTH